MTPEHAREILLMYRPGTRDDADPEVRDALTVARANPELNEWLRRHCEFQQQVREKLRSIEVPAGPKDALLARHKVVELPPWWQRTPVLAAACAALVLFAAFYFLWDPAGAAPNRFEDFRSRMVSTVLREYRMDVESGDAEQVRNYMQSRGAPADYRVTPGLEKIELAGGGFLRWRNHPVSMVCFRRPDRQMVYLFVMESTAVADAPAPGPHVETVKDLNTASWVEQGKVYLLAVPSDQGITPDLP